jgi:putative transposase
MEKRTAFIEDVIYHVYNRGNGYEPIFRNFGNYDYFLRKYHEYMTPYWETMAWCLMPNHFHFMVRVKPQEESIVTATELCVKAYADFCNGYVQAYNKQHGRRGSLFMRSFKRKPVYDETYIRKLICYIHNNPVKDGIVQRPEEWFHSSYHELHKMSPSGANVNPIIKRFGTKQDFLHAHIAELNPGTIDLNARKVVSGAMFGDMVYDKMKQKDWATFRVEKMYKTAG